MNFRFSNILTIILVSMFCLMTNITNAATYFVVKYPHQADILIYVVDHEYQADLLVFKTKYEYEAKKSYQWFEVRYEHQADFKVYFVKYPHQADLKIFLSIMITKQDGKTKRRCT